MRQLYSLEYAGNIDFWAQGGDAARQVFIMPLSSPLEFFAFGVLAPSDTVLFAARGQVLDHLGAFIARMAQAGARVEFHDRAPLPDNILAYYINGDGPYAQEPDEPPKAPNRIGVATQRTSYGGEITLSIEGNESALWTMEGSARRVLVTAVPNITSEEYLAFGMVEVTAYEWAVNFVARLGSDREGFLSKMAQTAKVEYSPPAYMPMELDNYMARTFGMSEVA